MEQVIPQSKVGNKSAAYRRMGWFMAVILVLVLCAAGSLAWFNINMAETSLKQDVERRLQFTAQNKANALSLWFNSMQNQANRLISADLFRLFASEVNGLGNDLSPLLKASGDSPSGNDDLSQLASQLPLMKNLLQEFISYSGFLRARITNADAQTYLSTDVTPPALSLEQQQGIRQAVESGKLGILPVRKTSNGLVLDLVVPIFAPQYVENRSEKPVATLLLSLMVSSVKRLIRRRARARSALPTFSRSSEPSCKIFCPCPRISRICPTGSWGRTTACRSGSGEGRPARLMKYTASA